jgi:hypothetical protein
MYITKFLNNLKKIELVKNNKTPMNKWRDIKNQRNNIDITKYNIGFPTGEINNIIVLDIDFKDDGIIEFDKYIKEYGTINTLIVKTPNKGFHYYFLYNSTSEARQHLIEESLTNKTKYRNKGLDIRTNGGYIVAPKSSINNIYYEIINDIEPIEIPESLIFWLLETNLDNGETKGENKVGKDGNKKIIPTNKKTSNKARQNYSCIKYKYEITDEEIIILLNKLDKSYLENYIKWLIILTILKNLDKFEIFDNWSKKCSAKYNYNENLKMWNANKGFIDINYLIKKINEEHKLNLKLIQRYKPIENKINAMVQKVIINKEKLEFDDNLLKNNNVLIIESDTGTGKTTHVAKQIKKYIGDNNIYQVFSIVNLINLANQQLKTFNEQQILLISYKDEKKYFITDHIVICINSLILLKYMDDEYFKNKILYLDEINSLFETLTHNDLLIPNIKIVYEIFIKFIKYSHKIIVSDATIQQNVFDLLLKYRNDNDSKHIINEYKKHQKINAIRVLDEELFLNKIFERIKNDKYFLFGCDSCTIVTKFYNLCIDKYKDKKDNFILITADSKFILTDASTQFKNKWVFYSPSISSGVDFSINEKQDHFIYAKGDSINPTTIYQQSTRNRNIDKLYYYFEPKQQNFIFDTLDNTKKYYSQLINTNDVLNNVCRQLNEDDETYIIENKFFELFCYNEYIKDLYNTNKRIHYEQILKNRGFILSIEGEEKKLSTKTKKGIKNVMLELNEIEQYLKDEQENKDFDYKYEKLRILISYFNLKDDELETYKTFLTKKYEREHYFNFIKLIKSDEKKMLEKKYSEENSYEIKQFDTIENKINIIKTIYSKHKIKYLSLDTFDKLEKINITNEEYKIIKHVFRSKKEKPTNGKDLQKMMLGMVRNIIGYLDIIKTMRTMNAQKKYFYIIKWNDDKIKFYLNLYKKKDYNDIKKLYNIF